MHIIRHELKQEGNQTTLYLYLDPSLTEFAAEFGGRGPEENEDLNRSVSSYIKQKFPELKNATVKIMVGSMLVTSFAMSPALGLFKGDKAEAAGVTTSQQATADFKDVTGTGEEAEAIKELKSRNMIKGFDDGTFRPNEKITRGTAAIMFQQALGLPNTDKVLFKEINPSTSVFKAVQAVAEKGIFGGYGDKKFHPERELTVAQISKALVKAYGLKEVPGGQVPKNASKAGSLAPYVTILFQHGIMTESDIDNAGKVVNRGDFAVFVKRGLDKYEEGKEPTPVVVDVSSVSSITTKDITIKLAKAVGNIDAKDINVKVDGKVISVASITKDVTDTTGLTYKLVVDLDGQKGTLTINDKASTEFDFVTTSIETVTATASNEEIPTISGTAKNLDSVNIVIKDSLGTVLDKKTGVTVDKEGKFSYTKDSSIAAGTYTVEVTGIKGTATSGSKTAQLVIKAVAPTASGVEVLNNKQIKITFSEPILNADTLTNNIKLVKATDQATDLIGAGSTAVVSEDKRSVIVRLDNAKELLPAQYILTMNYGADPKNISDTTGNKLYAGTELTFSANSDQLADIIGPALLSSTYNTETRELTLKFDELVDVSKINKSGISIGGVKLTPSDTAPNTNGTELKLILSTTTAAALPTGALAVDIADNTFYDVVTGATANGNKKISTTTSLVTPPKITTSTYDQLSNILTLSFDQPVSLLDGSKLTVSDGTTTFNLSAAETKLTGTNNTWTFNLNPANTTSIEGMNVNALKTFTSGAGAIENEKGTDNLANDYTTGKAVTYSADTVKPTLNNAEYNNNTKELKLNFSEKVGYSLADITEANISIQDATGAEVFNLGAISQGDIKETANGTSLTVKLMNNPGGTDLSSLATSLESANAAGKTLKVVLGSGAFKDEAGNTMDAITLANAPSLNVVDVIAPTLLNANSVTALDNTHVKVQFSEKISKSSAENIANYRIMKTGTSDSLNIKSASLQFDGKTVILTTDPQNYLAVNGYTLTASGLQDLQGNVLQSTAANPSTQTFTGTSSTITTPLTVTALTATSVTNANNDVLQIDFSSNVNQSQALTLANYKVQQKGNQADYSDATTMSLADAKIELIDEDSVRITLGANNLQTGKEYKVSVSGVTDVYGNSLDTTASSAVDNTVAGDVNPVAGTTAKAYANEGKDTIVLTLNEELNRTSAETIANYTPGSGTVESAVYNFDSSTGKSTVTLTLDANTNLLGSTSVTIGNGVVDLAGNSAGGVLNNIPITDGVKPTLNTTIAKISPNVANDTMVLTFTDNDILGVSATQKANYTVKDSAGNTIPSDAYSVQFTDGGANPDSVTITFDGTEANAYNLKKGETYSVTVSGVKDTSGNTMNSVTKTLTWDTTTDVTAPALNPAITSVDSATKTMTVTFNEDVDASTAGSLTNYTVVYSANGTYSDSVTFNPIFVGYNAGTKVATIVVSDDFSAPAPGSKFKITVNNIKDIAGNVQTVGSTAEKTN